MPGDVFDSFLGPDEGVDFHGRIRPTRMRPGSELAHAVGGVEPGLTIICWANFPSRRETIGLVRHNCRAHG